MFKRLKHWYWCHMTSWKEELAEQRLLNKFYEDRNKKDPSKIMENTEQWLIQCDKVCRDFDRRRRAGRNLGGDL